MMRITWIFSLCVWLMALPAWAADEPSVTDDAAAVEEKAPATETNQGDLGDPLAFDVEWAALGVGGGNYWGVLRGEFFTLKYSYFYWNILNGVTHFPGGGYIVSQGGTELGLRVPLGVENRHEVRLGLGLGVGVFPSKSEGDYQDAPCSKFGEEFFKLIVATHASYLYHLFDWLALKSGFELRVPAAKLGDDLGCEMHAPEIFAYVGVAF